MSSEDWLILASTVAVSIYSIFFLKKIFKDSEKAKIKRINPSSSDKKDKRGNSSDDNVKEKIEWIIDGKKDKRAKKEDLLKKAQFIFKSKKKYLILLLFVLFLVFLNKGFTEREALWISLFSFFIVLPLLYVVLYYSHRPGTGTRRYILTESEIKLFKENKEYRFKWEDFNYFRIFGSVGDIEEEIKKTEGINFFLSMKPEKSGAKILNHVVAVRSNPSNYKEVYKMISSKISRIEGGSELGLTKYRFK